MGQAVCGQSMWLHRDKNDLRDKSKLGQEHGMLAKGQENVTRQQSITSCQKLQRGQESEELKSVCLM